MKNSIASSATALIVAATAFTSCSKQYSQPPAAEQVSEVSANGLTIKQGTWQVSTFAGSGLPGIENGLGSTAKFMWPYSLTSKGKDVYVIQDQDYYIRKVSQIGYVSTFLNGHLSGSATGLLSPEQVCYNPVTNCFYITDENRILKMTALGVVTVFAGDIQSGYVDNANPALARFKSPTGICADAAGNIYVADRKNHCIRKITPAGVVTTFSGKGTVSGYANGLAVQVRYNEPMDIAFDHNTGFFFVADKNNVVRMVLANGGAGPFAGNTQKGSKDGIGSQATFQGLTSLAIDNNSMIYALQDQGAVLRKIDKTGNVITIVGANGNGYKDGAAITAQFNGATDIAVNENNDIIVTDSRNHRLRRVQYKPITIVTPGSN